MKIIIGWFTLFFVTFSILYYLVGMHAGKKAVTENDYFLAGRDLGFWRLTGTLLATQVGAGLLIGSSQEAYLSGFPGLFYGLSIAVGFCVLGLGIAGALRSLDVGTTAEIFEKYFASPFLKKTASFLSVCSLAGIFISQIIASRTLMVGLGIESELLFIVFWVLLIGYTTYGGLPAVVATDLLQIGMIALVFIALISHLVFSGVVGAETFTALCSWRGTVDKSPWHWFAYFGMPLLYSLIEQDLAQRFFSARSIRIATASVWASAVGMIVFSFVPALIGVQARLSGLIVGAGESPLMGFVRMHYGPIVLALVMCALVAAIASTADSLLCAVSSNVVQDFLPASHGRARRLGVAKYVTALVGAAGLVASYYASSVLGVMIESYALLVSSVLVSVLMCLLRAPLSRLAATVSVFCGFSAYVLIGIGLIPTVLPGSLLALGASLIGYGVGLGVSRLLGN